MATICEGKNYWPELVGKSGEDAVKIIEEENSLVSALLVPPTIPTRDFRCDRVFVYVDENGIVKYPPGIG
ncbi:Proteinase inhibitor [Sesamum angolense]|uniref:Proteinase inhibitor n=1 Tax=Sesamum angolense TaxID=2727404 RepID=A0AAE1W9X7_9LAMI|nr:Proteinase inhibitor [Sesamum angolense]